MKRPPAVALVSALVALGLAGCTPSPPPPPTPTPTPTSTTMSTTTTSTTAAPTFTLDTFPMLDGSTACIPLMSLMLQELAGVPKAQADNIQVSTTSNAYMGLATLDPSQDPHGRVLIVGEPDQGTKDWIADRAKLEYHPIGRDGLVFLANAGNPVTGLTTDQYRQIYLGSITNWKQVGGQDTPIVAYQRPEANGSQALLRKYVVGTAKLADAPTALVATDMAGLIDGVAGYANSGNALGYSVYYYAKDMYAQPGVKILSADGVAPSPATIKDGSYPYVNDFYAVIRADEPPGSPARQVVAWLESDAGQQAVVAAGYVGKK